MKWPAGPLEIRLREGAGTLTSETRQLLTDWEKPEALDFLRGSPINSLVVTWAAGRPEDAQQQRALRELIQAGSKSGLSCFGLVEGSADLVAAAAEAHKCGLKALIVEQIPEKELPCEVVASSKSPSVHRGRAGVAQLIRGCKWPEVKSSVADNDMAEAGPTGLPWLDSNGWLIRLAQAVGGRETRVWIEAEPKPRLALTGQAYARAVADSAAFGGQWLISLDQSLRSGLRNRENAALETWREIGEQVEFFRRHSEWQSFQAIAELGVLSDFSGDNEFLSTEFLNLAGRRFLPFQIVEKAAVKTDWSSLKAILCIDQGRLEEELRTKLIGFANSGGLVIVPSHWKNLPLGTRLESPVSRFEVWQMGQGRVAAGREAWEDPYLLEVDTHLLVSHRHDPFRIWNPATVGAFFTASTDRARCVLHLVNYSSSAQPPSTRISVWLQGDWPSARLWSAGRAEPTSLKGVSERGGREFHLPPLTAYAAIEAEAS
ncbi:MAG: hypothetical protein AB1898_25350 [Acidobacteriota bacterium]